MFLLFVKFFCYIYVYIYIYIVCNKFSFLILVLEVDKTFEMLARHLAEDFFYFFFIYFILFILMFISSNINAFYCFSFS